MNITPKLNLNRHPKDSLNLSLVNAHNVKIANDESCITNEEAIKENTFIHNYLQDYYDDNYKIVGIIPCNNELIIIVKPANTSNDADIFRYQEPINFNNEGMYCAYGGIDSDARFKYSGGIIKGAFTYNVENSLIVAISEYNSPNEKVPLRTINLGNKDDNSIYNDKYLKNAQLSLSPEVKLPSVSNLEYRAGSAYKGWYYTFIRYKLNSVDYTQWYSVGFPIYIDTLEQYQIVRYCYNRDTKFASSALYNIVMPSMPQDGYGAGCSDYFSNTSDIAKETFKVDLTFDGVDFTKYQVGLICSSKSYLKAFRTSDINLNDNYEDFGGGKKQQYVLDNKSLVEYAATDLIRDNFNYFNVKSIVNYQNRLYISNYLEDNVNNDDIPEKIISDINVELVVQGIADYGLVYDTALITNANKGVNQYDTYDSNMIPLHIYLNISEQTMVTVTAASHPTKTAKAGQFYIVTAGNLPSFAYLELREPGPLASVIKTNYGKEPNQQNVYLTLPSKDGGSDTNIILNTATIAINGGMQYINPNISFKTRKQQSTLIPGEVYNFFIHFTNKYNHATNGYQLSNKVIWDTDDTPGVEIIPIPFNIKVGTEILTYYAAAPVNQNVSYIDYMVNNEYSININNIRFYKNFDSGYSLTRLFNKVSSFEQTAVIAAFREHFSSYADVKFSNVKWYQISYGPGENNFHLFINNNGDRLFKMPTVESFKLVWDGFPDELEDFKTYHTHTILKIALNKVVIPEGYDGYYISYEQYEPQFRATGLLTRNDFRSQDYITVGSTTSNVENINSHKSDKMFFYSSIYDISDTIKLDYNIMRIEAVNPFKKTDIPEWDYMQRNYGFGFAHDMNKPQVESYGEGVQKTYAIPEYKIAVGDSAVDDRMGLGTALQLKDAYNLFPNYDTTSSVNNMIKLYRVTLLNTTRDIYMSTNKKLVRLSDIYYRDQYSPLEAEYSTGLIANGYNGHYTYDGVLIYENAGISFNTTTNEVKGIMHNGPFYKTSVTNERPHTYQNDIPFLAYLQLPICTDVFFESKSFKNPPTGVIYVTKVEGEGEAAVNRFAKGSMVTPQNSIDLFENRQGTSDQFNPKTSSNYREDLVSVEQFDKTVRRSNVIQDESRVNAWRDFPVEGYKNITENKGKISNLIGIGTILLVHTEHSLFMFNTDNTLRTQDREIQLSQPDAFEVQYKEVFTSDKGFGGLQDDKAYIVDQFGYIFYSNDTNRIYRFDNNQLDYLDEDIIQWLYKYKPFNIRMANDKNNNRILIKFNYYLGAVVTHTIVSYNYKVNGFVSEHDYYFDEAHNTKVGLYLQCNESHNNCSLHSFDKSNSLYGQFDNIYNNIGVPIVKPSSISIIVNSSFSTVKFLEYINYKLTKYKNDLIPDFTNSPVEEYSEPFAGNAIRVYNNMTDTGTLDINVNTEEVKNIFATFDKPYWDLGVWNFSYLRNNIDKLPVGLSATEMSRIFGNYFVVKFTFDNTDGLRVDFEELNYNISES